MLICCVSDLHGTLPQLPDCDLLIIAGDLCGPSHPDLQYEFLSGPFRNWIDEYSMRDGGGYCVCVEGNHGILAGKDQDRFRRMLRNFPGNFDYLEDDLITLYGYEEKPEGLKIFGTPSSLPFGVGWAFNYPEEKIEEIFKGVEKADIIISHGPMFGIADVPGNCWQTENVGSVALKEAVDRIKPKLLVTAHIHSGYGIHEYETYDGEIIKVVGAAHMNEDYRPVNPPILINIEF